MTRRRVASKSAPGGYAAVTEPRRPSSRLVAAPLDELDAICATALARLEAAVLRDGSRPRGPLFQATERVTRVEAIARKVARERAEAEAADRHRRDVAASLADDLAAMERERDGARELVGAIAERRERVRLQRETGEQPAFAVEALVWELAALDAEEDVARERAGILAAKAAALRGEGTRRGGIEQQVTEIATAQREGTEAALRWATFEALLAIEESAAESGLGEAEIAAVLEATSD